MSLKGKVAFVTGSTSGIGLAIAHELAAQGADMVINGFGDAAEIEAIRADFEKRFGVRAMFLPVDVTDYDAMEKGVAEIEKNLGSVDILVNNAGIQFVAPVEEFPIDKWKKIIDINLSGVFYGIRAVLPGMQKRGFGRIINIASAHGLVASAHKSAYVSAKHGVVGLTKVVALENARANITCNAICPGWVLTPLVQKQIEDRAKQSGRSIAEESEALVSEKQPNARFTTPEEIGALAVYLCSEAARGVNGAHLSIDGAWTAQ
ncbi:MAG: 3-hydroxybutyrate dehydrogenase [Alphaproteobacteria bacterium]|nr:3-hydroxybutyrate dehydrogenase [Alphaproteobacteria bacterium]OIN85819.1 MAG: 3-hydroxybutyrate dehydrogenase [Alphaproteobacteria bacterium CG1_02_46_17]